MNGWKDQRDRAPLARNLKKVEIPATIVLKSTHPGEGAGGPVCICIEFTDNGRNVCSYYKLIGRKPDPEA